MRFSVQPSGVFVVRYDACVELSPELQSDLIDRLRAASCSGETAVVFLVGSGVPTVDFSVPRFWLGVIADPSIRMAAMAIVTGSIAVRIAANAFGAASSARRSELRVQTFDAEETAMGWAADELRARRGAVSGASPTPAPAARASR